MNVNGVPDDWRHEKRISFGDIQRKLNGATLPERNVILEFVRSNSNRIRPPLDDDWLFDTMSHYFLDCVARQTASTPDDSSVHTPFEAAHELVGWFNWIVARNDNRTAIQHRIERIAAAFRNGSRVVQNCLETGFLEHVLETPRNRPYFAHWKDDELLADSYTEALRWGEAHTKPNAP